MIDKNFMVFIWTLKKQTNFVFLFKNNSDAKNEQKE